MNWTLTFKKIEPKEAKKTEDERRINFFATPRFFTFFFFIPVKKKEPAGGCAAEGV